MEIPSTMVQGNSTTNEQEGDQFGHIYSDFPSRILAGISWGLVQVQSNLSYDNGSVFYECTI